MERLLKMIRDMIDPTFLGIPSVIIPATNTIGSLNGVGGSVILNHIAWEELQVDVKGFLGQGGFGKVYTALWKSKKNRVSFQLQAILSSPTPTPTHIHDSAHVSLFLLFTNSLSHTFCCSSSHPLSSTPHSLPLTLQPSHHSLHRLFRWDVLLPSNSCHDHGLWPMAILLKESVSVQGKKP